jgi:hypothetical protein
VCRSSRAAANLQVAGDGDRQEQSLMQVMQIISCTSLTY